MSLLAFWAGLATSTPAYVIKAPTTLGVTSNKRFLSPGTLDITLQQSAAAGGAVTPLGGFTWAYVTYPGYGEEFVFQGTRFVLSGLANSDGGTFEVFVDGVSVGTGSTYSGAEVYNQTHFDSGPLPYGTHRVRTEKRSGYAHFFAQLRLY